MSVTATLASANDLLASHVALVSQSREAQKTRRRELRSLPSPPQSILKLPLIPSPLPSPPLSPPSSPAFLPSHPKPIRSDLPPAKRARYARYDNYVPEEETIRNDYSQRYVDGGEWPQNWVLGADPDHRFEEYPKQQRLLSLKKASVAAHSLPPQYLPFSELATLSPSKFDVILIDPPFSSNFTWDDLQDLPIPTLAADPSFVLLWVGSGAGEGLERGRQVLAKWGFRRCEDIVWIKTNDESNQGPGTDPPTTSLLTRTKQHCLMGIRGTVRRSTDSWFVHCNVDTDVMISAPSQEDPTLKPEESYTLIENFCLGLRRLELFGRARTLRRGWVSVLAEGEEARVGETTVYDPPGATDVEQPPVKWERESWETKIKEIGSQAGGRLVVPMTSEIDSLRPKSPVRNSSGGQQQQQQQLPNILPQNPATMGNVVNSGPRIANVPASGRVMMGPPISVAPIQPNTFENGVINPILNWTDISSMGNMQATPMGMRQQQPTPRMNFNNAGNFNGGGFDPMWDQQGAGHWDDSGVFISNNVGVGGGAMGVPDVHMGGMGGMSSGGMGMSSGGMGGMSGMGMQGVSHGGMSGGVGLGMGQAMNPMGAMSTNMGMGMNNALAMGGMGNMQGGMAGMQGANMRGMGVMGNMGMGNTPNMGGVGMGNMGMSHLGLGGKMNMGQWGGGS
ncbi:hypothetical protein EIP91_009418 [Steccherinum ochraceum]|uniref:MT-A70-domain-containing protein n=1 Tax=Steccherinum ochraceum TaxID=92696 RepID=A0A4R0R1N0_9APHY|nr:hypothetical protein EIP91_009418 [Steccherinum ochraceum]